MSDDAPPSAAAAPAAAAAAPDAPLRPTALLAKGTVDALFQQVDPILGQLSGLHESQETLLASIRKEREALEMLQALQAVSATMSKIGMYQGKLSNIRKEMYHTRERSQRMLKRADKLRQEVENEMAARERERAREIERDRALLAQPADGVSLKDETEGE